MGRSPSCFKIITCGGDSAENDGGEAPENKSSRGWRIRKRSERHRVLSGSVIAETPSVHKEIPGSAGLDSQPIQSVELFEKTSMQKSAEEKPQSVAPEPVQDSEPVSAGKDEKDRDVQDSEPISTGKDENERDVQDSEPISSVKDENVRDVQDQEPISTGNDENEIDVQDSEPISTGKDENDRDADVEDSVVIEDAEEKPQSLDAEPISAGNDENDIDVDMEESLAQRNLLKHKSVVKLQAAVRGHLVRKHAVGSLRCVQGIFKVQTLVRTRRARLSLEGSCTDKKPELSLEEEQSATKPNVAFPSLENLLSNKFAQQLMESSRKTKRVNIKCNPLEPNSAWFWLERWMSVSVTERSSQPEVVDNPLETMKNENVDTHVEVRAPSESPDLKSDVRETEQSSKQEVVDEQVEPVKTESIASPVEVSVPSHASSELPDLKSDASETIEPSENEENLITYDEDKVKLEVPPPTSLETENLEKTQLKNTDAANCNETSAQTDAGKETPVEVSSKGDQTIQADATSETVVKNPPPKLETKDEQLERSTESSASDQSETEGQKHTVGSRKASNPAFMAAKAKFQKLTSTANSGKSISSSSQDVRDKPVEDTAASGVDPSSSTKSSVQDVRAEPVEDTASSVADAPSNKKGSVQDVRAEPVEDTASSVADAPSNTKDSVQDVRAEPVEDTATSVPGAPTSTKGPAHPGSSECGTELSISSALDSPAGTMGCEQGAKLSEPENSSTDPSTIPLPNEPVDQPESESSGKVVDSLELEQEKEVTISDPQRQIDPEPCQQASASPEATPGNHITVPESQGTPSSQVSLKAKKSKTDKSNQKRKSSPSPGKSPSKESSVKSSIEPLPQKGGKRRSSFGSTKPFSIDLEIKDGSSGKSIPRFMQATESAKAKVHAHNSPSSSPDVHDKDIHFKKRLSLPGGTNVPKIHKPVSQTPQGVKGNNTPPSQERKWQR